MEDPGGDDGFAGFGAGVERSHVDLLAQLAQEEDLSLFSFGGARGNVGVVWLSMSAMRRWKGSVR